MLDKGPVKTLIMLEKEEIGEGCIQHVRVSPSQFNQLQTLSPAVPAPPERLTYLLLPWWTCVSLNRHHVQTHSVTSEMGKTFDVRVSTYTFTHKTE